MNNRKEKYMDELLSLAFSMQTKKGIYAILLGSGISRPSGILTGWEITVNLVKALSVAQGVDSSIDPLMWYSDTYKKEPDYSEILQMIAKTPSERQQFLEKYFEPSEQEREEGIKLPTPAHREIAKLVKLGYIKVIVTTNFDRLMEIALFDEGVSPTIISNIDSLRGATPIVHAPCILLKLHGDYKDTRIKNTIGELEKYDDDINDYLDCIFDEFGLIICGWSAEWDTALRNSLLRRKNRRYSIYWTGLKEPTGKASELISFLEAEKIIIRNADSFFITLSEKVQAISANNEVSPLSTKTAIAMLKKFLSKPENKIRLYDFINSETKRIIESCSSISQTNEFPDKASIQLKMKEYEHNVEMASYIWSTGCFFDNTTNNLWHTKLSEIATIPSMHSGYSVWIEMSGYPTMILYYVSCMACLFSKNYKNLFSLMKKTKKRNSRGEYQVFCVCLHPLVVFETSSSDAQIFNKPDQKVPANYYLYDLVEKYFEDIILTKEQISYCFDTFEYLNGLMYLDEKITAGGISDWAPPGRFCWNRRNYFSTDEFFTDNEMLDYDSMIECGFFKGDREQLENCRGSYKKLIDTFSKY